MDHKQYMKELRDSGGIVKTKTPVEFMREHRDKNWDAYATSDLEGLCNCEYPGQMFWMEEKGIEGLKEASRVFQCPIRRMVGVSKKENELWPVCINESTVRTSYGWRTEIITRWGEVIYSHTKADGIEALNFIKGGPEE